jgi:hypothetical protein
MQQWTEQAVKACLDGRFYRLTESGRVITRKVTRDYIPSYEPPPEQKQATARKGTVRRPWDQAELSRLVQLRALGVSIKAAASTLGRCPKHTGIILKNMPQVSA